MYLLHCWHYLQDSHSFQNTFSNINHIYTRSMEGSMWSPYYYWEHLQVFLLACLQMEDYPLSLHFAYLQFYGYGLPGRPIAKQDRVISNHTRPLCIAALHWHYQPSHFVYGNTFLLNCSIRDLWMFIWSLHGLDGYPTYWSQNILSQKKYTLRDP